MPNDKILFFIIIYGVGVAVLTYLSLIVREAGRITGAQGQRTARSLVTGLWLWAVLANAYAMVTGPDFLWLAPSFLIPMAVGVSLTFVKPVTDLLRNISLTKLVALQVYRNAGAIFLIAYFVTGTYMSRQFVENAGWGDILTGMLAIPTALAVHYRVSFWQLAVVVWCAIGIGDLILAPLTALIYGGLSPDDYPMNVIAIFLGPPLGVLLHVIALRAMWLQRANQFPEPRSEVATG